MADMLERAQFAARIMAGLEEHPDWLPDALEAVTAGMKQAVGRMNQMCARSDAACLAALGLLDSKRITPELRDTLGKKICEAIHPQNMSAVERRILEEFAEQPA